MSKKPGTSWWTGRPVWSFIFYFLTVLLVVKNLVSSKLRLNSLKNWWNTSGDHQICVTEWFPWITTALGSGFKAGTQRYQIKLFPMSSTITLGYSHPVWICLLPFQTAESEIHMISDTFCNTDQVDVWLILILSSLYLSVGYLGTLPRAMHSTTAALVGKVSSPTSRFNLPWCNTGLVPLVTLLTKYSLVPSITFAPALSVVTGCSQTLLSQKIAGLASAWLAFSSAMLLPTLLSAPLQFIISSVLSSWTNRISLLLSKRYTEKPQGSFGTSHVGSCFLACKSYAPSSDMQLGISRAMNRNRVWTENRDLTKQNVKVIVTYNWPLHSFSNPIPQTRH